MRTIVTYTTTSDVPDGLRCIAKFRDGKGFLPLLITAPTEDAARAKAEAWWTAESERQAKIKGGSRPAAQIIEGLQEALAVAKGDAEPFKSHEPVAAEFEDLLG